MFYKGISYLLICVMCLGLLGNVSTAQATKKEESKVVIVLDPGHGGTENGTTEAMTTIENGKAEKVYNLAVAKRIKDYLEADGRFTVYMTREDDTTVSLMERAKYADSKNADAMISIHFNSSDIKGPSGLEVWQSVLPKYQLGDKEDGLGQTILDRLSTATGLSLRKDETTQSAVKERPSGTKDRWNAEKNWDMDDNGDTTTPLADYYGLIRGGCKCGVPTMIVEHGFLNNAEDCAKICSDEGLDNCAQADAQAIIDFYTGHSHEMSEESVDIPTSCIHKGKASKHCTICGKREEVRDLASQVDKDAHYLEEKQVDSTFWKTGSTTTCRYGCGYSDEKVDTKKITIYHTNDIHGEVGALDRVATLKKQTDNALLVDAGDATQGNAFTVLSKGLGPIDVMNQAGYDLMCAGNHEFDYPKERMLSYVNEAKFPILAANVYDIDNKPFATENVIKTVAGVKIGFFGLTTCSAKTSVAVKDLTFKDEIETAKAQVDALKDQGAEVIICLGHLGEYDDSSTSSKQVAEAMTGKYQGAITAIIDGHSHTIENTVVNDILIAQTGNNLANVGKLTLSQQDGKLMVEDQLLAMDGDLMKSMEADPETTNVITRIKEEQKSITSEEVGQTKYAVWGDNINGLRESRLVETVAGDAVCEAILRKAKDLMGESKLPLVSIINAGSIRTTYPCGKITMGDIINMLPFENYLVLKELTPKSLCEVLEQGLNGVTAQDTKTGKLTGTFSGGFFQAAGLQITYNPNKEKGSKLIQVKLEESGEILDPTDDTSKIMVASNDYIMSGGDGFEALSELPTYAQGDAYADIFTEYVKLGLLNNANVKNRILPQSEYEPKGYTAKVKIVDQKTQSLAGKKIAFYVDYGAKQTATVDAQGYLNVTLPDGPHTIYTDKASEAIYVCNYSGQGTETFSTLTASPVKQVDPVVRYMILYRNGSSQRAVSIAKGDLITAPAAVTKRNYLFMGWYLGSSKYVFPQKASKNITLTAKWKKVTVKKAAIKKVKRKKKVLIITMKNLSNAAGYQVRLGTNKKITKGKLSKVFAKGKITIKVPKNKKYYVKVRGYALDSTGKKVYGKYSAVKAVAK